jgi:hypothetical protein
MRVVQRALGIRLTGEAARHQLAVCQAGYFLFVDIIRGGSAGVSP